MALIDKTYFVGELNIARTNNASVAERLDWFIEKYETELLQKLLGVELYAAFIAGIQVDPIDQRWSDLLYGTSYYGGKRLWKGFVSFSGSVTTSLLASGSQPVVVGGAGTYDPVPDQATATIPPAYVGRTFKFLQRGIGQLRPDEYSVAGNVLTLQGGVLFSNGDTFFYDAPYSLSITGTPLFKQSLIAPYVYYWWMRDQASHSTSLGESKPETENAVAESPVLKMCRAWNEMSAWVRELVTFLDYNRDTYPEWLSYTGYCALEEFRPINRFGI